MQSFVLLIAIFFGHFAFAGAAAEKCRSTKNEAVKECNASAMKAAAENDAAAKKAWSDCVTKLGSQNECATQLGGVGNHGIGALEGAKAVCDAHKGNCERDCRPSSDPNDNKLIQQYKKECTNEIAKTKGDLDKGTKGAQEAASGGKDTANANQGNGQNPMMPPMPPPKEDDKKEDEKKAETTPASIPTEAKKEDPKPADGKTGFDEKSPSASPQSLNACSPLFAQKCSSGDTSACLAKLSAADRQKITADCSNTSALADPNVAKALTSNTGGMSAQSLPGNGTSGGGAMGGGGDSAAMLVQPKTGDDESQLGKREGGSMGVDSAGGGGGYSGDSGNIFGEDPATPVLPAGLSARGLASAFGQSTVDPGHSVVDRYGPSVFSIVESTLQSRCARNLHYHCRPQAR